MIILQSGLRTENSIHHSESLHIHLLPSEMGVLASKEDANAISRRAAKRGLALSQNPDSSLSQLWQYNTNSITTSSVRLQWTNFLGKLAQ